jgi:protocatechuate 3,4-dioxygenase beta subunit
MDNDDRPVGRVLSRREALAVLGAISAAALAACSPAASATFAPATTAATTAPATLVPTIAPTSAAAATSAATTAATAAATTAASSAAMCVVRPALTEGPYFVDEKLNRSDIRSDPSDGSVKDGIPLVLTVNLSSISNNCTALSGATVDVWHCDAAGQYSDVNDQGFNTKGKKFLRGYQTSDANGQVKFTTIYPGWYSGRAVHIHFKIRTTSGHEFTSQWFFDDSLSDTVFAQAPYAAKGTRNTRNSNDGIYSGGGNQLVLAPSLAQAGGTYSASFDIGLQF